MILESFARPVAGIRDFCRDIGAVYTANAVVAFLFSCTGPVAIIVSVGLAGGLSESDIGSWIFGGFLISGIVTIFFSLAYRQPLSFAWTIPGTVLLGSALDHLRFSEIIGTYIVTGILIGVIGLSGGMRKALQIAPMPIVLAMVAGIFLQFGLDLVHAFDQELALASAMVLAFLATMLVPRLKNYIPPVVMALFAGIIVVWMSGSIGGDSESVQWFGLPNFYQPEFTRQSLIELVVPLAITVLVAQNGQGFAVLMNSGHNPPANAMTTACGGGSILFAFSGAVCMCVTGPANAVLASSGERTRQYTAAVIYGVFSIAFGILAFAATWLILKLPPAFIAVLGGLALLPVLQQSFVTAFQGKFQLGALVTLLVTVSDITIWNVGAPFWGLVLGLAASFLIERNDFREMVSNKMG